VRPGLALRDDTAEELLKGHPAIVLDHTNACTGEADVESAREVVGSIGLARQILPMQVGMMVELAAKFMIMRIMPSWPMDIAASALA
jgi:hypothetical protein